MTRVTIPVWMMPLAITSIAATVITPPLLRAGEQVPVGVTRVRPATASPVASARTGGTLPDAIATSVPMTMTAARYIIEATPRSQALAPMVGRTRVRETRLPLPDNFTGNAPYGRDFSPPPESTDAVADQLVTGHPVTTYVWASSPLLLAAIMP